MSVGHDVTAVRFVFFLALLTYSLASANVCGCKSGGSWQRPGGNVGNAAGGFEGSIKACNDICKSNSYTHFGLECPMSGATHCQCASSSTSNAGNPVWDSLFGTKGADTCQNSVVHCNAAHTLTHQGFTYYLGGASIGSVYIVR